jgi:hypothetical protein
MATLLTGVFLEVGLMSALALAWIMANIEIHAWTINRMEG